jgi:hypothetical protein
MNAGGDTEMAWVEAVSGNYFSLLGVGAGRGRVLVDSDDRVDAAPAAVISHALWQQRFNREPSVLGQTLTLDGAPCTIIGVLPEAASAFPLNPFQIWVPRPAEVPYLVPSQLDNGGYFFQASRGWARRLAHAGPRGHERRAGIPPGESASVDAPSDIEIVPLLDDAVGGGDGICCSSPPLAASC